LYDTSKVEFSKVVAPPYDVISPQMQDELYRSSNFNIVRLILGVIEPTDSVKNNRYTRAKSSMDKWLSGGVLYCDKKPALYVYSQQYHHNGKKRTRFGFIAAMRIEDPRKSKVLPHEYTFAKPKQDRLELLKKTQTNMSQIFTLFQDDGKKIGKILKGASKGEPVLDVEHEGVRHTVWRLTNSTEIKQIQRLMKGRDIFIADGHHRYEVAVTYRNEMQKKYQRPETRNQKLSRGYNYVMMFFSPLNQRGLTVLSTHRLIKCVGINCDLLVNKLKSRFTIKGFKTAGQLFKNMTSVGKKEYAFGIYFKNRPFYLLKLKKGVLLDKVIREDKSSDWKRLDVSVLHGLILDDILGLREKINSQECIAYTRDSDYAIEQVKNGNFEIAFFLNPTKVDQVQTIAKKAERMPHKSTYFYPKLLSGLVLNKLQ